ncbi:MAG: molybdopterin-dependent oxidoreductase [Planctomycetota bacterium]
MPSITINGVETAFEAGEKIIEVANRVGVEIPQYCYHDGLSIPAQCRICLAEVWAPNPRNDNKLEPMMGGKLLPTCSTDATDGMVVYADSPKAVANQKAVMEYLLINHPLDCPVCDQAGECTLQDFSFKYGRGVSRFEETKVKQPKKDLGPNVYIYSDRCIMCTRCVRFAREVPGTAELMIDGRGNRSEIDVFPGEPLDNPLSANVIDLCPVGALLDKDFLFAQRVWFLKSTPTIDGLTSSGDNLWAEHNEGKIYRLKPRTNMDVNTWWITDEVRYSWKFIHSDARLTTPMHRRYGTLVETEWPRAMLDTIEGMRKATESGKRVMVVVSPMLTSEEAYALGTMARAVDEQAVLAVGPVPVQGEDRPFNNPRAGKPFTMRAEKAPNARGVRRVLEALSGGDTTGAEVLDYDQMLERLGRGSGSSDIGAVFLTSGYSADWAPDELVGALDGKFLAVADILSGPLVDRADAVLPTASWLEKSGSFVNADGLIQAFDQAIPTQHESKSEGQIAADMLALLAGGELDRRPGGYADFIVDEGPGQVPGASDSLVLPRAALFDASATRTEMGDAHASLRAFVDELRLPPREKKKQTDVEMVEL